MDSTRTAVSSGRGRRHDLDLMRTGVVAGLVFYHTALIFGPVDFYVNDGPSSGVMTALVFFLAQFGMPLLFLVAGGSVWHSLHVRTTKDFVCERLSRLFVPLVVGIVLVVPPQVYFSLRAHGQGPGSYWSFLRRFFDVEVSAGFPPILRPGDPQGLFDAAHLWFLYYLLLYSLLLLPVFSFLRGSAGLGLAEWLLPRFRRVWGIALLAVPVALIEALLGTWGPGGWNRYAYIPFLIYGFLMASDRRLSAAVQEKWLQAAMIGTAVLLALFLIAHYNLGGADRVLGTDLDTWSVAWRLLKATGGWFWTVAMFGAAAHLVRYLGRGRVPSSVGTQRTDSIASYTKEAVLPFYVLHQTPIVIIGFYVVQWKVGMPIKYLTISLASFVATAIVYDICVRRFSIIRVLFGIPRSSGGTYSTRRNQISRQYE